MPKVEMNLFEMMGKRNIRTIGEVAELSGLSRKAVSAALNNTNEKVSFATIAKLCKALNCEPGDLLKIKKEGA